MAELVLNGITLDDYFSPRATQQLAPLLIGERRRAFGGGLREDVTARKERWKLTSVPLAQSDAAAIRGLVEGLGDSLPFNSDTWSTRGVAATETVTSGDYGVDAATKKHGAGSLVVDGTNGDEEVSFSLAELDNDYTAFGWKSSDGLAWEHWILRSDGSKWLAGVTEAGSPGGVSVSSGALVFGVTQPDQLWVDDWVVLPFLIPDAWAASIFAEHTARAWTAPPSLRATGTLFPDEPRTVRGFDRGSKGTPHMRSGTMAKGGEMLELELEDV